MLSTEHGATRGPAEMVEATAGYTFDNDGGNAREWDEKQK